MIILMIINNNSNNNNKTNNSYEVSKENEQMTKMIYEYFSLWQVIVIGK